MGKIWTSRERVEAALNHQEPDRVPMDITIRKIPYERLRDYLGLPQEETKGNRFGEVSPSLDVLKALRIDMTFIKLRKPSNWTAPPPTEDDILFDAWGVGHKEVKVPGAGVLLEPVVSPLKDFEPNEIDLDAYPWPDPTDPGFVAGLADDARKFYKETEIALMGRFGGTIMEQAAFIRGYEKWMMDLVLYPEFAMDLMNRITDIQIALDEAGIREAGKYLSIFKLSGEDLGAQERPLFSKRVWQNVLRPILKRRWQAARDALDKYDAAHVKLLLHSDGAIRRFLPDLIEDGVDGIDPVQVQCTGMEAVALKQDFGDKLFFHGAIDTQKILPFGTPDDVRTETKRIIQALAPGGGFILTPMHNVQPDVSPENLVAMCEAVKEFGVYPIQ
ncbi:MAG: uroporphyrinogen decarboxylase [Chloroflexi bacterium]|nr:MAG: uroporphyrinogen decarboxylase [Chloroflexota bacterium]